MKKLSLLLLTLCISLAGWAASLNPYAYNLSSTWNEATSELTVRFKLNAHPNMKVNSSGRGIQIFAIDPSDNNKQYYIYGVPENTIKAKMNEYNGGKGDSYDYELTIPITGVTWNGADVLPAGKNLTWAVNVAGLNKTDQSAPVVVNTGVSDDYRPFSCHGIAINKDQNSKDFGAIYVTEASEGTNNTPWNWIKTQNKGHSLLKYTPKLDQVEAYHKFAADGVTSQNFSLRNGYNLLEPHRVRISDDGRIFVSSYNKNSSAVTVVWEFDKNTRQFIPIINHNTNYGHRVCGMDVKGSGNNLKILLCYFSENYNYNSTFKYAFTTYEYSITSSNTYPISTGAKRILYQPAMGSSLTDYSYGQGVLNWTQGKQGNTDSNPNTANGYFYSDGFANVAYGKTNNTDIFFVFDYFYSSTFNTRTMYYKECVPQAGKFWEANPDYHTKNESNHYLGGAGFLTYKDGSNEYLVAGHAKNYLITKNNEGDGRVQVYPVDRSKSDDNISYTAQWDAVETPTKACINDMAMDPANNIYAISFSDGTSTTPGTGRIVAIAMPYSGATMTIAPSTNTDANRYFNVKPVPNILATDLRYAPAKSGGKYVFSFFTNTKPEYAEIRFYNSYDNMKQNLAVVNADNFSGDSISSRDTENLVCIYSIPKDKLKQGKIEVELGMVGGELNAQKFITNDSLPRGELYWSVYVQTRESSVFAPIYEQSTTGDDVHQRLHATVNNYPETDGFGHIYAVNYYNDNNPNNGLMVYGFNPNGNSNDEQNNIKNSDRYKLVKNYLNPTGEKPKFTNQRRLDVAPDGKVYIADCGSSQPFSKNAIRPWLFNNGGVYVWNPNTQTGDEIQVSQFLNDKTETSTGVAIYNHDGQLKMYATNTYGEFSNHELDKYYWDDKEYSEENQKDIDVYGWNGFKEYKLGTPENILQQETNGTVLRSLGMGDGNGNISIVAMEKGVWLAQNRLNDVQYTIDQFNSTKKVQALPDNDENYILSFVPYGTNERSWTSCSGKGIEYKYTGSGSNKVYTGYEFKADASELTQLTSSPLQACPGAGLAYRKTNGKEYLYIVNHQGNIVELQITEWVGNKPTVKYIKTYPGSGPKGTNDGGRVDGAINSMCFDYAGNLVTTSGADYLGSASQNVLVYTMPYDRTNAREIQAPNSCRYIPPRVSHLEPRGEIELTIQPFIDATKQCYVDIFRPMPNTSFSTICLPFDLDMTRLTTEKYTGAEVLEFTGVSVNTIGGEKILELQFSNISENQNYPNIIKANVPYIIKPEVRIPGIVQIQKLIQFETMGEQSLTNTFDDNIDDDNGTPNNSITYTGVIPTSQIDVRDGHTLILVAENRLAWMLPDAGQTTGTINGLRGYFTLEHALPQGMQTIISKKDKTVTGLIDANGQRVNIQKYLREGRVYIRMGDTLYTITGEKVK